MANSLNIAAGTAGQILKHNGVNTSPSFTSSYSGLKLIQTYTASNSASIDMTSVLDNTLYYNYLIIGSNITPANSGSVNLRMRVSTDNGSTWKSGASDYISIVENESCDSTISPASVGDDTQTYMSATATNLDQTIPSYFEMQVCTPASDKATIMATGAGYITAISLWKFGWVYGQYNTTTTVTAIQFFCSTGNVNTGTFQLYGYVK